MNNKNFYVVALISFFDNDIKQFLIRAENEFVAVKKAMVEFTDDKYKQEEIEFQQSEDYPKEIEELNNHLGNGDMSFSVIEVGSFLQ
jgi:parvulin-like peptidyl-prolyl isomerase